MNYVGSIYRPPSEAYSLIIQATVGCNHNQCTFCGTYRDKKFYIKKIEEIIEDLEEARNTLGPVERVFLADGDALCIPQARLAEICRRIHEILPSVKRIGIYGNAKNILKKSVEDLEELRSLGLGIIYMGVETGDEELLEKIQKGANFAQLVEAGKRVREAGILLSVTILLGIGGIEFAINHARNTADILSAMDPEYVGALSLMLVPGTPLYNDYQHGKFALPDAFGLIEELRIIIAESNFTNCIFRSNHASNYLSIRASLPKDKSRVLKEIDEVLSSKDKKYLKPEFLRGL